MTYPEFLFSWRDDSHFIESNTSGSTGTPKTILLPKEEMVKSARRTLNYFNLDNGSLFYSCISPNFIGGKMQAVRAEISSGILLWETPSNRPTLNTDGKIIDLLAIVPSQIISILDQLDSGVSISNIRNIIIGGSPIHHALRARIANSRLNCYETYGMTETCSHIAIRKITSYDNLFEPMPGIKVSTDAESRLIIKMPGWLEFHTNDKAEIDSLGNFRIKGRSDNIIVTGGKKVSPERYEESLEAELGFPILITSEPDEKWTQRIVLIAEIDKNDQMLEKIMCACRNLMPDYAKPKAIYFGQIPRTPNGKKARR